MVTFKRGFGASVGQCVVEHYHQYLGFSRYCVVESIVFYEVVMERVSAQYTKERRGWRMM